MLDAALLPVAAAALFGAAGVLAGLFGAVLAVRADDPLGPED